jgi:hypothetical protein
MLREEQEKQQIQEEEERAPQVRERLQREQLQQETEAPVAVGESAAPTALWANRAIDRLLTEPVINKLDGAQTIELVRSIQEHEAELEKARTGLELERSQLEQRDREHQGEQRLEWVRVLTRPVIAVGMIVGGVVLSLHGSGDLGATLIGGGVSVLIGQKGKRGESDAKDK